VLFGFWETMCQKRPRKESCTYEINLSRNMYFSKVRSVLQVLYAFWGTTVDSRQTFGNFEKVISTVFKSSTLWSQLTFENFSQTPGSAGSHAVHSLTPELRYNKYVKRDTYMVQKTEMQRRFTACRDVCAVTHARFEIWKKNVKRDFSIQGKKYTHEKKTYVIPKRDLCDTKQRPMYVLTPDLRYGKSDVTRDFHRPRK